MSLDQIDNLILQHYGLSTQVMGPKALGRAIRRRLEAIGLGGEMLDIYTDLIGNSPDERQELLELLVVPETWFFRNEKVFPYLVRWLTREWQLEHPGTPARILSLACATGEEPYSVVMALRDAGVRPEAFTVEAVDISARALDGARAAIYGRNSFRSFPDRDVTPIAHHLTDVGGGLYQVKDDIRRAVTFRQGNLHDSQLRADLAHGHYDAILCRNVMIYFPREGQQHVLRTLFDVLAPDGRLFVGHSELVQFIDSRFVSTAVPMTFSFRKRQPSDRPASVGQPDDSRFSIDGALNVTPGPAPASTGGAGWNAATVTPRPALTTSAASAITLPPPSIAPRPAPSEMTCASTACRDMHADAVVSPDPTGLRDAHRAANEGRLDDAVSITRAWLQQNRPTAEAFCLLGVVHDARGDADAAEHNLRRAIYLNPRHYEALVHLALLLERNGDPAASTFHRRAMRVSTRV